MDTKKGHPHERTARRIGKKAIFYGRLAPVLGVVKSQKAGLKGYITRVKAFRLTRKQAVIAACSVIVLGLATVGGIMYQQKRSADAQAAAKAEAARAQQLNASAQECYKSKLAEKQAMLGKITFDQLYDGDTCTASK